MAVAIPLSVEEQVGTFEINGAQLFIESDTPTTTPVFTDNTGLVRGDKPMQFRATWTPGGWVGSLPLPGFNWRFEVINERMGPNNAGEQVLTSNVGHSGAVVHNAIINVPASTYPAGAYHFTCLLTLIDPGGNPTPVVALAHINMVRIFNSPTP